MSPLLALVGSAAGLSLANSLHCAGMCGAFALTARARPEWHAGRTTTYAALGAFAGALGGAAVGSAVPWLRLAAAVLASLVLLWFSLRLAGWSPAPPASAGRMLQPLARILRSLARPDARGLSAVGGRFALGAAGSLVPCGVVYAGLALAALAGSPGGGALVMLGFALGTAPSLLIVGTGGTALRRWGRNVRLRRAAALLALALGLTSIWARAPIAQALSGDPAPPTCHAE